MAVSHPASNTPCSNSLGKLPFRTSRTDCTEIRQYARLRLQLQTSLSSSCIHYFLPYNWKERRTGWLDCPNKTTTTWPAHPLQQIDFSRVTGELNMHFIRMPHTDLGEIRRRVSYEKHHLHFTTELSLSLSPSPEWIYWILCHIQKHT